MTHINFDDAIIVQHSFEFVPKHISFKSPQLFIDVTYIYIIYIYILNKKRI